MGEVYFYQLMRAPVEVALPQLLLRALGGGWRIMVRGRSREFITRLDDLLWLGEEDGFLPHGLAGGTIDAEQPVLLTDRLAPLEGRDCLMAVEGADVSGDEVRALKRACILFDGNDAEALERARAQWRDLTAEGLAAQYWSDETGRWQMKSERAAKGAPAG